MGDETVVKVEYKVSLQCGAGTGEMPLFSRYLARTPPMTVHERISPMATVKAIYR